MNLYEISNPSNSSGNPSFPIDCSNSPLSSESVCDTSLSHEARASSLVSLMTLEEKTYQLIDASTGSIRLGILPHEWWNEALHGVAGSPGVIFSSSGGEWSYASSFPQPINLGASFDDPMVASIASIIGQEARAFSNAGFAGFNFWTPNINPFRDPRWGRGQETPGEDAFHIRSYVTNLVPGLQGGSSNPEEKQIIATCKHFAAYDIETNRHNNDLNPSQQDLNEYYLPPFKGCVRDAAAGSVMCAYNAVDGVPACASEYLLQGILQTAYNFTQPYNYVMSDCDAIDDIWSEHGFVAHASSAAAVALNAGCHMNCGTTYLSLNESVANGYTSESAVDAALTKLYTALFTIGAFDGTSPFNSLNWSDVDTTEAQSLAYQSSMEGLTLLKNDGTLPLQGSYSTVAVIGPMATATTQLQGNYFGNAPTLVSPLSAFGEKWNTVYEQGTEVDTTSTSGFAAVVSAAEDSDLIIYVGGIDDSIEAESLDRTSIVWPGNQLDLISELAATGKPLVVLQWGGGQVDDTVLLSNSNVSSLVWVGYPGEVGGTGIRDVLAGTWSIAGRLPVTQYPANYTDEVDMWEMALRPNGSYPGRTYKWYTGTPVLPFGHGLHYTNFSLSLLQVPPGSYTVDYLMSTAENYTNKDTTPFFTVEANVTNIGGPANMFSDYVGLLYLSTPDAGPSPYPNKWLASYQRLHNIAVGSSSTLSLPITLGSLARADSQGDLYLYPGTYTISLDNDPDLQFNFTLTGDAALLESLPQPSATYSYTVPVVTEAPTT